LFKNFIALWRHLAKTQLLCDAQIYLHSVNKRQYMVLHGDSGYQFINYGVHPA